MLATAGSVSGVQGKKASVGDAREAVRGASHARKKSHREDPS